MRRWPPYHARPLLRQASWLALALGIASLGYVGCALVDAQIYQAYASWRLDPPPSTPLPTSLPAQTPATSKEETLEQLKARAQRLEQRLADWGQLARFAEANAKLPPPARGEQRVIFYGDSITQEWKLEQSFPGEGYINRGITSQTTPQMLVRFRADVIHLRPEVVVILAGTNDIAGNTGPMTLEQIQDNYATMAELARLHHIKVLFCSVTPVHDYTPRAQGRLVRQPPEKILGLNRWLQENASRYHYTYVDYFSAMVDDRGLLRAELAGDGLHPNADGYTVMAKVVGPAVARALGRKRH